MLTTVIGSAAEKRTIISIKGFDRNTMKEKLEKLTISAEELKNRLTRAKQEVSIYGNTRDLTGEQLKLYESVKDLFFRLRDDLKQIEEERRALVGYLKTRGEGEVTVLKKVYPNTMLEIKDVVREINRVMLNTSFYIQDGEIKEI